MFGIVPSLIINIILRVVTDNGYLPSIIGLQRRQIINDISNSSDSTLIKFNRGISSNQTISNNVNMIMT